jgi:hypothetical protein
VTAGALLAHGCAAPVVDSPVVVARPAPPAAVPPPRVAPPPAIPAPPAPSTPAVRPGLVVAGDGGTGEIAAEIARRTGFGLVVGRPADAADAYAARVREAARGPLRFYAEIHGGDRQPCGGPLEIATVGVDPERALRLRTLAELIRDAHLRVSPEVPRLDVQVEPADDAAAARARRLPRPGAALHIALPGCAGRGFRETYTAILADFLVQAVQLPEGR